MTPEYRHNLAAKALLLRELSDAESPTGAELLERIERVCRLAQSRESSFDFVFWASGTLWDLLDLFREWGFLVADGGRGPEDAYEWSVCKLQITDGGLKFLRQAEEGAGELMALFHKEDGDRLRHRPHP